MLDKLASESGKYGNSLSSADISCTVSYSRFQECYCSRLLSSSLTSASCLIESSSPRTSLDISLLDLLYLLRRRFWIRAEAVLSVEVMDRMLSSTLSRSSGSSGCVQRIEEALLTSQLLMGR